MAIPLNLAKNAARPLLARHSICCKCSNQQNIHSFSRFCAKHFKQVHQILQSSVNGNACKMCGTRSKSSSIFQFGTDKHQQSIKRLQKSDSSPSSLETRLSSLSWMGPISELDVSSNSTGSKTEFVPDLKRFLSEVGTDPREARYWLKQFTNFEQKKPFAVVQVDPAIFSNHLQLEQLTSCIAFLQRNSMRPVLVCGSHLVPSFSFTSEELQELKSQAVFHSTVLASLLEAQGVQARPLFTGSNILQAQMLTEESFHGKITTVNTELVQWCLLTKHIPIIPAFGETPSGQIVALDMWSVTEKLSKDLQPLKVIKVNTCGGFVDETGSVIANIHLPVDLETSAEKPWCTPEIRESIERIYNLLQGLPIESSVVITSVDKMLKELFTHRGSGTFFKITEPILQYRSFDNIDMNKLADLFTMSFRKTLKEDYFDKIQNSVERIYLSENYNAAAIILKEDGVDIPYLCKFAVSVKAQGEGTGEMLWEAVRKDYSQLYWRSRGDNHINSWYFRKCEGSWSNRDWTVFWYGISQPSLSSCLIDSALSKEESFLLPPHSKMQEKEASDAGVSAS